MSVSWTLQVTEGQRDVTLLSLPHCIGQKVGAKPVLPFLLQPTYFKVAHCQAMGAELKLSRTLGGVEDRFCPVW